MEEAIVAMLRHCFYIEDIEVMKHFVFHPRMNMCSNACLLCGHAASVDDPLWEGGHGDHCPYVEAIARIRRMGGETLDEYKARV